MKALLFLATVFCPFTALAQSTEVALLSEHQALAMVEPTVLAPEYPLSENTAETVLVGQEKAKKGKADRAQKEDLDHERPKKEDQGSSVSATAQETVQQGKEKGQAIKEVATAKRQSKPEKVTAEAAQSAKRPAARVQSAARPGRGAATNAVKAAGNAAKAAKPVKVGGAVGVGIKVGKN